MADSNKIGFTRLLKNKAFARLWISQIVSLLGDTLHEIAIVVLVLEATGNKAMVGGIFLAAQVPPIVISLIAGILADRWNRKRLMIACDIVRFLLVIAVPLAIQVNVVWVFLLLVGRSIISAIWQPVLMAVIPDIVSNEELLSANSLWQGSSNVIRILGYAIGGILVAQLGTSTAFYMNGIAYIISALLVFTIIFPKVQPLGSTATLANTVKDMAEGLAFMRKEKTLMTFTTLYWLLTVPFGMFNSLLPVFALETLQIGSEGLGTINSMMALGGVAGALVVSQFSKTAKGRLAITGVFIELLCYIGLALTHNYWAILVIIFISGADSPLILIPLGTIFQIYTPSELRGRVYSIRTIVFSGLMAAAMGIGPWLSSIIGIRALFGSLAMCLLLISIIAIFSNTVKTVK